MNIWTVWSIATGLWMILLTFRLRDFRKSIRFLSDVDWRSEALVIGEAAWPKVSLIVPACNEADTIARAAETLLSMDYPNLELVLIDDRSSDGTGRIIRDLARRDSRIRPVTITDLPAGWLGKLHALHRGVEESEGEWMLFSDADVHFGEHSLRKAIAHCRAQQLDFLAVTPSVVGGTFALKVIVAHFLHWATLAIRLNRIRDPDTRDCAGTGVFNLVQRDAYRRSRGWTWLKMEVIDDSAIAQELKSSGARVGLLSGLDEIEIEWYPSLRGFVKGMEKNGFAVFQYSATLLGVIYVVVVAIFCGFTFAPIFSESLVAMGFVWGALAAYLVASAYAMASMMRVTPWVVTLFPVAFVLMPLVFVRSAVICLAQRGIYWRGTFYPLADLRREQRLKVLENLRVRLRRK